MTHLLKRLERDRAGRAWILFSAILAGLALIGLGFTLTYVRGREQKKTSPDGSDEATTRSTIPPIDAAAPQNFQTATFALG